MAWAALALGALAFAAYARAGLGLLHYDARAHLVVARRILDSRTPGIKQLGTHWLPLPHLLGFLPARSDFLYRTGLAASLISLLAWWGFLLRLRTLLAEMRLPAGAVRAGVSVAALHPGLLYLAGTPMTEPLFFFLLAGSAVHLRRATAPGPDGRDTLGEGKSSPQTGIGPGRPDPGRRAESLKAGVWLALGCLARYEAWGAAAAATLSLLLQPTGGGVAPAARSRARHALLFAAGPGASVAGFLLYSAWATGSLAFLQGVDAHRFPGPASLPQALALGLLGLTLHFGWLGLGCLALALAALLSRRRVHPAVAALLLAPLLASVAALWAGLGYRPRYLLSALLPLATGWAIALRWANPVARRAATAALVLQGFVPLFPLSDPLGTAARLLPALADSEAERLVRRVSEDCFSHLLEPRAHALVFPWPDHAVLLEACATDLGGEVDRDVARALRRHDDGEPVLAPMADLAGWMYATGLPLRRFIHEGNWPDYEEALRDPATHAGWVALRVASPLARRMAPRLGREGGFVRFLRVVDGSGYGVVLYRRLSAPAQAGLTPPAPIP